MTWGGTNADAHDDIMPTIVDLQTHAARYVTVAELAAYWEVSRECVYKHIANGALPALRFGPRCYRVPTHAAAAFERHMSLQATTLNVDAAVPLKVRAAARQRR